MSLTVAPGRDQLLDWRLPLYSQLEVTPGPLKVFVRRWLPHLPKTITEQLQSQKEMTLCSSEGEADLVVQVRPEGYDITNRFDPLRPLVARVEGLEGYNPTLTLDFLTHIHRWRWLRTFIGGSAAERPPASVAVGSESTTEEPLEVFRINANGGPPVRQYWENQQLWLDYEPGNRPEGSWGGQVQIKLTNTGQETLFFSVLFLSQNFEIVNGLGTTDPLRLPPGEAYWLMDKNPLDLFLEDQTVRFMWPETNSFFMVLATPAPFDQELYLQEGLPVPGQRQAPRKASYFVRTRRQLTLPPQFALARLYTLIQPNPLYEETNLYDLAGQMVQALPDEAAEGNPQQLEDLFFQALKLMWQKAEAGKMEDIFRRLDRLQSDLEKALAGLGSGGTQTVTSYLLEMLQVMEEVNELTHQTTR